MHKIDHPQFHPVTFKRDPKDLYYKGVKIVFDTPRGVAYRNGARVRATSNARPEKRSNGD